MRTIESINQKGVFVLYKKLNYLIFICTILTTLFLIGCATTSTAPAFKAEGVDWKLLLIGTDGDSFYYNSNSIVVISKDIFRFWVKEENENGIKLNKLVGGKRVKQERTLFEINCTTYEWRRVSCLGYDFDGNFVYGDLKTSKWGSIEPGMMEVLYKIICTKNKDVHDGVVKKYYPSGKLQSEDKYTNNGLAGISKAYYENGKLLAEGNLKDGKLEGISKGYYESGKLKNEVEWKDGKQEGISKEYYESGKLLEEGNYKDGKREGISKEYYESGKLLTDWNYKDGKREGISKEYYESGKLLTDWNYKDGKREGISKVYYESGKLLADWNYKDGKREGITKVYNEDGKLKAERNFKDGKQMSITCYDVQGNKTQCPQK